MRAHLAWRAAVVAVLLVAGACGSGGGGEGDPDGPPTLPVAAAGAGRSSATMSAEAAADSSAAMIAPAQPIEYRVAAGADDVPGTATAYEVRPRPKDEVRAEVAAALDVEPDRVEVGVSGYDWYYSRLSPDTPVSSSAASSPECAPDEACGDPSGTPAPPPTVPGVPSAAAAEERARDLLEAMDVALDGRFEVFGEDGYNRTVQFTPSVDGIPVAGLQTQIAFGGDARIEYANGVLADIESVGEYPLVGLDEAVERLRSGFGAGGDVRAMGVPEPAIDPAATSGAGGGSAGTDAVSPEPAPPAPTCVEGEPCTSPPSPPRDQPTMTIEPDRSPPTVPLEPQVIEITGADLSLQLVAAGCPGDPVYLVPAFDLLPGPAASVIAVEDEALAGAGDAGGDEELEPCPDQGVSDGPVGRPEPAPMPADAGREPAKP